MSEVLQKSERSYVTSLRGYCTDERTITEYDIPGLGIVRCQSLKKSELDNIRAFPANMQYAAAIAAIMVDEHGDTTEVLDDESVAHLSNLDSRVYDAFVDIINGTVLNQASIETMVKNSAAIRSD